MKSKVGELYGKPIVVGNPNEFCNYEIPLKELLEGKISLEALKLGKYGKEIS